MIEFSVNADQVTVIGPGQGIVTIFEDQILPPQRTALEHDKLLRLNIVPHEQQQHNAKTLHNSTSWSLHHSYLWQIDKVFHVPNTQVVVIHGSVKI